MFLETIHDIFVQTFFFSFILLEALYSNLSTSLLYEACCQVFPCQHPNWNLESVILGYVLKHLVSHVAYSWKVVHLGHVGFLTFLLLEVTLAICGQTISHLWSSLDLISSFNHVLDLYCHSGQWCNPQGLLFRCQHLLRACWVTPFTTRIVNNRMSKMLYLTGGALL